MLARLAVETVDLPGFPEIGAEPVSTLQLVFWTSVVPGQGDHLVGHRQAVNEPVGGPERGVAGAEGDQQRVDVLGAAGELDRLGRERVGPGATGCVVQLDC